MSNYVDYWDEQIFNLAGRLVSLVLNKRDQMEYMIRDLKEILICSGVGEIRVLIELRSPEGSRDARYLTLCLAMR